MTKFFLKILLFTPQIGTLDPDPHKIADPEQSGLKKSDPDSDPDPDSGTESQSRILIRINAFGR